MFALISPNEIQLGNDREILGQRVAEIREDIFEVAPPLFWVQFIPQDHSVIYYYKDEQVLFEEYIVTELFTPLDEVEL
jgi:hypothetical protein